MRAFILAALWAVPLYAVCAPRHRVEQRPAAPESALVPAAAAPRALAAPVLSGLDYTALAPPGVRLRVIEDEPYTYVNALHAGRLSYSEAVTQLTLRSDLALSEQNGAGYYEARISLRAVPAGAIEVLEDSFDAAAESAYTRSLLTSELRGATAIGVHEVRSPLNLTDLRDHANAAREYLAYSAAALNPNNPSSEGRATPYQFLRGELRVLRRAGSTACLLTLNFEAGEYPYALTLTENIARCVVNRLNPQAGPKQRLNYLAYHPESELSVPDPGEALDPRIADLAEQPGESAGLKPLPIQGDRCAPCPEGETCWPARPYADGEYGLLLGEQITKAACSHCLLESAAAYGSTRAAQKQRIKDEKQRAKLKKKAAKGAKPKDGGSKQECPGCHKRDCPGCKDSFAHSP
jgi:hypothetical protein